MFPPTFLVAPRISLPSVSLSGATLNWLVGYSGGGSSLVNVDRRDLAKIINHAVVRESSHLGVVSDVGGWTIGHSSTEPFDVTSIADPKGVHGIGLHKMPEAVKEWLHNWHRAHPDGLILGKKYSAVDFLDTTPFPAESIDRLKQLANRFSHQRYYFWLYHRPQDQAAALSTRQLFLAAAAGLSDAARITLSEWLTSTKGEFPELEKDNRYRDGYRVLNEILPVPLTQPNQPFDYTDCFGNGKFKCVQKLLPPKAPYDPRSFLKQQPYPVESPHPVPPTPTETPKPSESPKHSSMLYPPVSTNQCPPGQFWDGRRCRGSVSAMPNIPSGLPTGRGSTQAASFPGAMGVAFVKRLGGAAGLEA